MPLNNARYRRACVAFAVAALTLTMASADEAKSPATTQPTAKEYASDMKSLRAVWLREANALGGPGHVPATFADENKRKTAGPAVIPLLKSETDLIDKMAGTGATTDEAVAVLKLRRDAKLMLLADADTKSQVAMQLASNVPNEKFEGQSIDLFSQFFATGADAAAQEKLVDKVEKLDTENPAQSQLAILTLAVAQQTDSGKLNQRLMKLMSDTLTSPTAVRIVTAAAADEKKQEARRKSVAEADVMIKSLEGKPMTIVGKTPEGKDFTSADFKGKVILVDFWATWCGPCIAALPEVKEQYAKYHDQGFEIIGISDDSEARLVTSFTARHAMPWPQLFDFNKQEGAAAKLVAEYHVTGIPRAFLIDKAGIVRSIDAGPLMKTMIPKLMAE